MSITLVNILDIVFVLQIVYLCITKKRIKGDLNGFSLLSVWDSCSRTVRTVSDARQGNPARCGKLSFL